VFSVFSHHAFHGSQWPSQWTFQRQLALMKDVINVHITILSVYYLAQFAISTSFNNWLKKKKDKLFWRIDQTIFFRVFFPWVKSQVSLSLIKKHTHNPRGLFWHLLEMKWLVLNHSNLNLFFWGFPHPLPIAPQPSN
jgi:hypothetical protein